MSRTIATTAPPTAPGDVDGRGLAMPYNRGATAVVQGMQLLNRALAEINLAVDILSSTPGKGRRSLRRHVAALRVLEHSAEVIDSVQRDLQAAWGGDD